MYNFVHSCWYYATCFHFKGTNCRCLVCTFSTEYLCCFTQVEIRSQDSPKVSALVRLPSLSRLLVPALVVFSWAFHHGWCGPCRRDRWDMVFVEYHKSHISWEEKCRNMGLGIRFFVQKIFQQTSWNVGLRKKRMLLMRAQSVFPAEKWPQSRKRAFLVGSGNPGHDLRTSNDT